MQLNSGIYIISYNNKNYVGSSSNLKKRIREHFSCLKRNTHPNSRLQRAFNKYGIEAFSYKIVSICPPEYLIKLEQWFIDNTKNTVNLNPFAYSSKGRVVKKSTRKKISKALIGKVVSDETRQLLSKSKLGKLQPKSEETKEKMSKAKKGIVFSEEHKQKLKESALKRSKNLSNKVLGENNPSAKLNWDMVKIIRESNDSVVNLASLYGVAKMTIYKIKNNKIWKEV